jgi:hypothetical protein
LSQSHQVGFGVLTLIINLTIKKIMVNPIGQKIFGFFTAQSLILANFEIICKDCQKNLLVPSFHKREIEDGFFNYSFYSLSELEDLINSKYYFHGDRVFNILAKLSFAKFALNFDFPSEVLAIPIDDHTRHDFSHTAIGMAKTSFSKIKF